jgi:putative transposase
MRLIDEQYTHHPFYGARKIREHLNRQGIAVSRLLVGKLMRFMGLQAMVQGSNTSKLHPGHKIYPYLLRGVEDTPHQSGVEHGYEVSW